MFSLFSDSNKIGLDNISLLLSSLISKIIRSSVDKS